MNVDDLGGPSNNDPFDEGEDSGVAADVVDIRIQQRTGRKSITTVTGLPANAKHKDILKVFKTRFCCNGTLQEVEGHGIVLQLSGDQRKNVAQFLLDEGIVKKDKLKVHGF